MKNFDLMCLGVVAVILIGLWWFSNRHPARIVDRQSPLPSGLYTNGAPSEAQSNNVAPRVNFRQQPVG